MLGFLRNLCVSKIRPKILKQSNRYSLIVFLSRSENECLTHQSVRLRCFVVSIVAKVYSRSAYTTSMITYPGGLQYFSTFLPKIHEIWNSINMGGDHGCPAKSHQIIHLLLRNMLKSSW